VIEALLIAVLIALVGLALIVAGLGHERRARDNRRLKAENARLRSLVRRVEIEARAQLSAGNASFEPTLNMIGEHREKESA
jgi:hypothetical protein